MKDLLRLIGLVSQLKESDIKKMYFVLEAIQVHHSTGTYLDLILITVASAASGIINSNKIKNGGIMLPPTPDSQIQPIIDEMKKPELMRQHFYQHKCQIALEIEKELKRSSKSLYYKIKEVDNLPLDIANHLRFHRPPNLGNANTVLGELISLYDALCVNEHHFMTEYKTGLVHFDHYHQILNASIKTLTEKTATKFSLMSIFQRTQHRILENNLEVKLPRADDNAQAQTISPKFRKAENP